MQLPTKLLVIFMTERSENQFTFLKSTSTKRVLSDHEASRFDSRWMTSLANLQLPVMLLWGDDDAVAPMAIPKSIATIVPKERLTFKTMPKAGERANLHIQN